MTDRTIRFLKATSKDERAAINTFLIRHNQRGAGSNIGYVAYYAALSPSDGRPLVDRIIAAAKICPLHTPQAARFFAGEDWKHVYTLQRLAAWRAPENLLSRFLAWVLKDIGRDPKVWYVATYADTNTFNPDGVPHNGGIYRAANAVYCGLSKGGGVEGYILDGKRYSMRQGPKTMRVTDIPPAAKIIRSAPKHRYAWAVGAPLKRLGRQRALKRRMAGFRFEKAYQPRLLAKYLELLARLIERRWQERLTF